MKESITKEKVQTMLDLQDEMNSKVNSDWREQGFAWYRAIWIECAEMLDHYGWKWWKKQTPDVEQVKLELIDIWHFGLSILILNKVDADAIASTLEQTLARTQTKNQFAEELESFVAEILSSKSFSVPGFAALMQSIGLEFDQLYRGYVGKNVLNFFRQDNGYKTGTYQKQWRGREDNEHLVELVADLDNGATDFKDQLYTALDQRYRECQS